MAPKGRRRLQKPKKRKRGRISHHPGVRPHNPVNPVPSYDAYLDTDYIEEMFSGNVDEDYNIFESLQPPARQPGYSMIEETDIDSIDRNYPRHRLF